MPPLTQRTRRRRRRTRGHGGCRLIELEEHLRADRSESGMGAGHAHGEGAYLLEINRGIIAVVSKHCEPARANIR